MQEEAGKLLGEDLLQGTTAPRHQSTNAPTPPTAPLAPPTLISQPPPPYQSYLDDLNKKLLSFKPLLDLRGKRVDEAYSLLQRYLDDAVVLSIPEVSILHGKGNGILRQVTREYLATLKEVKKFQDAPLEAGGSGITIVTFK